MELFIPDIIDCCNVKLELLSPTTFPMPLTKKSSPCGVLPRKLFPFPVTTTSVNSSFTFISAVLSPSVFSIYSYFFSLYRHKSNTCRQSQYSQQSCCAAAYAFTLLAVPMSQFGHDDVLMFYFTPYYFIDPVHTCFLLVFILGFACFTFFCARKTISRGKSGCRRSSAGLWPRSLRRGRRSCGSGRSGG